MRPRFGQLAQLVEQRIENPRVRGSIPRLATKDLKTPALTGWRFAFWVLSSPLRSRTGGCLPVAKAGVKVVAGSAGETKGLGLGAAAESSVRFGVDFLDLPHPHSSTVFELQLPAQTV